MIQYDRNKIYQAMILLKKQLVWCENLCKAKQ